MSNSLVVNVAEKEENRYAAARSSNENVTPTNKSWRTISLHIHNKFYLFDKREVQLPSSKYFITLFISRVWNVFCVTQHGRNMSLCGRSSAQALSTKLYLCVSACNGTSLKLHLFVIL